MSLSFTVYGIPQPQGSARAFMHKGAKFPSITTDNTKLKPWRQELAGTAQAAMQKQGLVMWQAGQPLRVEARFIFQKPKSTKKAAIHKVTKPDLDKLIRALFDAMTGIVFHDDAQICQCQVEKSFGMPSRAEIIVVEPASGQFALKSHSV